VFFAAKAQRSQSFFALEIFYKKNLALNSLFFRPFSFFFKPRIHKGHQAYRLLLPPEGEFLALEPLNPRGGLALDYFFFPLPRCDNTKNSLIAWYGALVNLLAIWGVS